jgi:pyridoxal phosphate enzyme (YggS family)
VQEGLEKIAAGPRGLDWHLIGHLQTNKAKKAAAAFPWIHSIDSLDLLVRVDRAAAEAAKRPFVLIQVDLAGEATKHGAPLEEVANIVGAAERCEAARLVGLMLLPPFFDDPEDARPYFRRLRELRDMLVASGVPQSTLAQLSMGMSHDFEVAIQEGATMVRVGTAIFGERDYR